MEDLIPKVMAVIVMVLIPIAGYELIKWAYSKYKRRKYLKSLRKRSREKSYENYSNPFTDIEINQICRIKHIEKDTLSKYCNDGYGYDKEWETNEELRIRIKERYGVN